jgi:hypothetical protein
MQRLQKETAPHRGRAQALRRNVNDREVTTMIAPAKGILLLGLGVLIFAVATAIHDTWWLQRKVVYQISI